MKDVFLATILILAAGYGVAQSAAASGLSSDGKGLRMKFDSRLDAVNQHLANLEVDMAQVMDFREKVKRCYAQQKFIKPSSASADGDGCVGATLVSFEGRHDINTSAGGCAGEAHYIIPQNVYSEIDTATFHANFERAGNRTLEFVKGIPVTRRIRRKVDSGWFDDDHCHIQIIYNGNAKLTTTCYGDGRRYCNQNQMKHIEYQGKKIKLGQ